MERWESSVSHITKNIPMTRVDEALGHALFNSDVDIYFLLYDHTVISAFILDVPLVAYIGRWMPSGHIVSFESIEHLSLLEIV